MSPLSTYSPAVYDAKPVTQTVSPILSSAALPLVPSLATDRFVQVPIVAEVTKRDGASDRDADASWFPADHLFAAVSDGARTRSLLAAVDHQARLLDDLLAACSAGAATLPPALLQALQVSAVSLAAV